MHCCGITPYLSVVALRKESVDRNQSQSAWLLGWKMSLSARRAWIEIVRDYSSPLTSLVALRKESVDRNQILPDFILLTTGSLSARRAWIEMRGTFIMSLQAKGSLSARRAWIEIPRCCRFACSRWVALRKESVDRNKRRTRRCCGIW